MVRPIGPVHALDALSCACSWRRAGSVRRKLHQIAFGSGWIGHLRHPESSAMSAARSSVALEKFAETLQRVAGALERLAPPTPVTPDFDTADAFVWHPEGRRFAPVPHVN